MIIRIFKISTKEMWKLNGKKSLVQFIEQETNTFTSDKLTIDQLIKYLPKEEYYRMK
jgi:hypothetical protein